MWRFFLAFLFSVFLAISFSGVYANTITIVKDHQPKASIVIPDSSNKQIQNAAKVLQDYIKKSTGAILPINTHGQRNSISIHVGLTPFVKAQHIRLNNLDEDGFILQAVDAHDFIIVGGSDWGTEFGVYSFLEKYAGVHWLMPSQIGTDVPLKATLDIPEVTKIENPVYLQRQISPGYIEWKDVFSIWSRFNAFRGRISFGHNLLNLFNVKEFLKTNPDFYPFVNGKRIIPKDSQDYKWQPNFSAPGIVDSASAKIIRYFHQYPDLTSYSLGMNDFTTFDQSAKSLTRRNGKKNYLGWENVSDDYFEWANEVAQKVLSVYPNKYFGLLAYNNTAEPPSAKIGINAHIIPFLTYERLRWSDPVLEQQGHQLTENWANECTSLGWYDYVYGLNYLIPRVWFHKMQDYLKWGTKHKVKYYYAELYPNWGEGPKPWILSKLLWNPNRNIDSLLNVWYVATAGKKSAPYLKEYYDIWETFWSKDIFESKWNTNSGQYLPFLDLSYLNDVSPDYIHRADELMSEAYNFAETSLQKQRVSKLKEMWQVYKLAAEIYKDSAIPQNKRQQYLSNSPGFLSLLNQLGKDPIQAESIKWIKLELKIK